MEKWRGVFVHGVAFEGYQVSNFGRVKSLERTVLRSNGVSQKILERILKSPSNAYGYPVVVLHGNSRPLMVLVHRLVLEAFVGPCPEGMECLHGPGGKADNRLENLRWGTQSENEMDKVRDGTSNRGERHGRAKLTDADVVEVRLMRERGDTLQAIADRFGVHPPCISRILNGKRRAK